MPGIWHLYFSSWFFIARSYARNTGEPFAIIWSAQTFGLDGTWHVVEVTIGTPGKTFRVYPGGQFQNHLFSREVCGNPKLGNTCPIKNVGVYQPLDSFKSGLGNLSESANLGLSDFTSALHVSPEGVLPDDPPDLVEVSSLSLGAAGAINQSF
ncbi:hypothetical protein B0J14DRAFT_675976 [Halenospora varia]|nr:hypothetical protein B0J14DRAFT_675976 [Halenospora varia]